MKTLLIGLILVGGINARAAVNCEDHDVWAKLKTKLNALVGQRAGGNDKILKIEKIDILTSEDDEGNIKALFTFEETIGESLRSKNNSLFSMKGYAKIKKSSCKQVDGIILGSTHTNSLN